VAAPMSAEVVIGFSFLARLPDLRVVLRPLQLVQQMPVP
jgi:hypothetical protein